jgi:tRNA U34 5-carboxymethylaminomethyl modifying GTPase MnmE/TrmE
MPPTDTDYKKAIPLSGLGAADFRAVNERYDSIRKDEPVNRATTVLSRLNDVIDRARKVEGMTFGVANQIAGHVPEQDSYGNSLAEDRTCVVTIVRGATEDLNEILRKIEGDLERIAAAFL